MLAVVLTADGTDGLMLYAEESAVHMAGGDMRGAMPPPAVAACCEMAANAVDAVAGGARARARRTEGLPVDGTEQGVFPTGGAPARAAIGQPLWARQLVADIARQGMLAAERVPVTGAEDHAASPHWLLTFVAGQGMRRTVGMTALRACCETGWAKTACAANSGAALEMNVAMVAVTVGVRAARSTGGAAHLAAGAAKHLISGAGYFVAAGAAHSAIDAEWGLINMAGEGMGGTAGASTGGAGAGAGDANRLLRDGAAHAMIGAGVMSAIFGLDQTGVTDSRAID